MDRAKPYDIPKREVWEAYKRVRANQGAAGVDGQTISDFEAGSWSGTTAKLGVRRQWRSAEKVVRWMKSLSILRTERSVIYRAPDLKQQVRAAP